MTCCYHTISVRRTLIFVYTHDEDGNCHVSKHSGVDAWASVLCSLTYPVRSVRDR